MCGRFVQQLTSDQVAEILGATSEARMPGGRFNVAPTQPVLVLVEEGQRRVVTAHRWGLIPPWAKDPSIGPRMINARAETVAEKPAFRGSFRHHRCIIPADAFYEWQKVGSTKTPYAIHRRDGKLMALAGLWAAWHDVNIGAEIMSCAIITTEANATLAPIHDRMPVILPEDTWDTWLDPKVDDRALLQSMLRPAPDDLLEAYPISRRVNDVRNDDSDLLTPLAATG